MILGVWHFSWTVSDLDRSTQFYTELLGFELVRTQEQSNPYTRALVGFPDAHLKVAMFKFPGLDAGVPCHVLELVQYLAPAGAPMDLRTCNVGCAHLALYTDNIHHHHARLVAAGVKFRSPAPVAITAGANQGGYACYFHDPDGFTLELLQPPAERLAAQPPRP